MTDITTGRETQALVKLCPECASASIETTTLGIIRGKDTNKATCLVCGWVGVAHELVTAPFTHSMGSDESIAITLFNEMRIIIAKQLAVPAGAFLLKWGFLKPPVQSKDLGRYMGAIARAVMTSIIEERKKIEEEKSDG
jgi:hypothetical protein